MKSSKLTQHGMKAEAPWVIYILQIWRYKRKMERIEAL